MGLLGLIVASFLAALSGAIVPGPVFAVTIAESIKRGYIAGPLIILGHFMIETIIIILLFLGLGAALESASVRVAIGYIGGVMLMLMGFYLMIVSRGVHLDIEPSPVGETQFSAYGLPIEGFLTSVSNPHFFLWWAAIGMPIMYKSIEFAGIIGFTAFLIGHISADLGWFGFVSYSIDKGKKFLSDILLKYIVVGSGIFLVILGISFIQFAYKG
ncbi:MAG: LysE family transporter [Actinomycetota bacterium]|nr:LysE family transporter [Actinomycetota bacterium]